jgi:crotonobetainyl-CoA:carnitine CoA-transferase CaiB-like acyl-CoA transferase
MQQMSGVLRFLSLPEIVAHEGFAELDMLQDTYRKSADGTEDIEITTTRSPLKIDGSPLKSSKGAPHVGEDTEKIRAELLKDK